MKARICEFCKVVIPQEEKPAMSYSISIEGAFEYIATTRKEKALLLIWDDVCMDCTKQLVAMIRKFTPVSQKGEKKCR